MLARDPYAQGARSDRSKQIRSARSNMRARATPTGVMDMTRASSNTQADVRPFSPGQVRSAAPALESQTQDRLVKAVWNGAALMSLVPPGRWI